MPLPNNAKHFADLNAATTEADAHLLALQQGSPPVGGATPTPTRKWSLGSLKAWINAFLDSGITSRVRVGNGTAALPSLGPTADPDTGLFFPSANTCGIATAGVDRVRITSTGDLQLEGNAAYVRSKDAGGAVPRVLGINGSNVFFIGPIDAYAGGPVQYGVSANVTLQSFFVGGAERVRISPAGNLLVGTAVDRIGRAQFFGGASLSSSVGVATELVRLRFRNENSSGFDNASIVVHTDQIINSAIVSILARSNGGTELERLRIDASGNHVLPQIAPAAVNSTATLTVANLRTRIITSTTAAAVTGTLPTGTLMDGLYSAQADMGYDWSVINTGPNAFTVAAGTDHTLVGAGAVASGASGSFRSRRTAANTWITYRVA